MGDIYASIIYDETELSILFHPCPQTPSRSLLSLFKNILFKPGMEQNSIVSVSPFPKTLKFSLGAYLYTNTATTSRQSRPTNPAFR